MPSIEIADRSDFKQRLKEVLEFDPAQAVVVTVDLQREYLDEEVGESVVEPDEAIRVLESNRILLDAARAAGIPVVHAYVVRQPHEHAAGIYFGGLDYMKAAQDNGISQSPHRPPRTRMDRAVGTPASEVPAACVAPGDIHIADKKGLDSYLHTELEFLLSRVIKPRFVILTGINTDTCVYATTFTTANLGYSPIVVADCVASMRGKDSHVMALELMSRSIAWVLTLDEMLAHIKR
jgi:biuret amidohydrolase